MTASAPHTALVTGASRGLGLELARHLSNEGYRLVLTARNGEPLARATEELSGRSEVIAIPGDIRDETHRRSLVEAAGPSLALLINNASDLGTAPLPPLARYDLDALRGVFEANTLAPLGLIQLALTSLHANSGRVVNISSDAARGGYPGWGGYGASKAALDLISLTLASELEGVAVVAVDPGDMRTEMHQAAYPDENISDRKSPEAVLPFFAWMLERPAAEVNGRRFEAQAAVWETA